MMRPQTQQLPTHMQQYSQQFNQFSALLDQIHPEYLGLAWGVAHREGLDSAIAFCETKIQDSNLMQTYRDSDNANNNQ